jgi:hypothetical protein
MAWLFVTAAILAAIAIFTAKANTVGNQTENETPPQSVPIVGSRFGNDLFYRDAATGADVGGTSIVAPSSTIHWRAAGVVDSEGATVESVLHATAARLSHLQQTPAANDRYAQALFEIVKALDILEGK